MQQERKNSAFQEMLTAAKGWLSGRSPEELAKLAGAMWEPEAKLLKLQSLNQRLEVGTEDWSVRPQPEEWHHLILLHYISIADGTQLSDEMISFGNLKDGLIRGTKFDRTADLALARFLKDREPEQIKAVCRSLGAGFQDSNARGFSGFRKDARISQRRSLSDDRRRGDCGRSDAWKAGRGMERASHRREISLIPDQK